MNRAGRRSRCRPAAVTARLTGLERPISRGPTTLTALTTLQASVLVLILVMLLDPRGRPVADWLPIMILYPALSALTLGAVLMTRRWPEVRRELADARIVQKLDLRDRVQAVVFGYETGLVTPGSQA